MTDEHNDCDNPDCPQCLRDELRELHRALGPWTVQTLRQYVADTSDGFECEAGCDSYGHTELCPVTNVVAAFRLLRERLAEREHVIEAARAWRRCDTHSDIDGARQWGCPDCVAQQRRELRERDERIRELEQDREDHEYVGMGHCVNCAMSLAVVLTKRRDELEQQLKTAQERLEYWRRAVKNADVCGEIGVPCPWCGARSYDVQIEASHRYGCEFLKAQE